MKKDDENELPRSVRKIAGKRGLSWVFSKCWNIRHDPWLSFSSVNIAIFLIFMPMKSISGELEKMFKGVDKCSLDNVFVIENGPLAMADSANVRTPEYIRGLRKIIEVDGVARYKVEDNFFGLKVAYIDVPIFLPRDDNQVWRMYFDESFNKVRIRLGGKLKIVFPPYPKATKKYTSGERPAILMESNTGRPYLACRKTELGD